MMLWRPLETSQVENLSPIRVKSATPCVLCPVRTCAALPGEHNTLAAGEIQMPPSAHALRSSIEQEVLIVDFRGCRLQRLPF